MPARSEIETREQAVATVEASRTSSTGGSSSSNSSSSGASPPGSSHVYYRNCDAARAAGAAPVCRGEPGYGRHLDRDNDGTGCE